MGPAYKSVRNRRGVSQFEYGADTKFRFEFQRSRKDRPRLLDPSRERQGNCLIGHVHAVTRMGLNDLCRVRRRLSVSSLLGRRY